MNLNLTLQAGILLVGCLLSVTSSAAQEVAAEFSAAGSPVEDAEKMVESFFQNWRNGEAKKNEPLFLEPKMSVMRVTLDHRPNCDTMIRHGSARELMQQWQMKPPRHLVLDDMDSRPFGEHLVVTNASYTGSGIKGRAVFTISRKEETWRISSLVLETRFNW